MILLIQGESLVRKWQPIFFFYFFFPSQIDFALILDLASVGKFLDCLVVFLHHHCVCWYLAQCVYIDGLGQCHVDIGTYMKVRIRSFQAPSTDQ